MIRRILAAVLLLGVAALLLILGWPQLFRLQQAFGVAQVVSLRALAVLVAVVGIVGLGLLSIVSPMLRRLAASIALLLLAFSLLNVVVLATRGFGNLAFETANAQSITVMSWNTLGGAPGPQNIATLAIQNDAKIVSLPETTEATGQKVAQLMANAGKPMQVWTFAYDHISQSRSTTLLISKTLGQYGVDLSQNTTSVLPSVVATPVDGTGPTIIAVHAVAPQVDQLGHWRSDLDWLKSACQGRNVIMAGDFNSTIDHYSSLASAPNTTIGDCTDAGMLSENAAVGTWPTSLPPLLGAAIDHIMITNNWRVSGMRVVENHDGDGSDHRPIVVQLSPAN